MAVHRHGAIPGWPETTAVNARGWCTGDQPSPFTDAPLRHVATAGHFGGERRQLIRHGIARFGRP
jgi:hypothetical protein